MPLACCHSVSRDLSLSVAGMEGSLVIESTPTPISAPLLFLHVGRAAEMGVTYWSSNKRASPQPPDLSSSAVVTTHVPDTPHPPTTGVMVCRRPPCVPTFPIHPQWTLSEKSLLRIKQFRL